MPQNTEGVWVIRFMMGIFSTFTESIPMQVRYKFSSSIFVYENVKIEN